MDTKDLKLLLHSFYEGETSKEEEKKIFDFFEKENISEDTEVEKRIFLNLYSARQNNIPEHLEAKLNTLIDRLERDENRKQTPHIILPRKYFSQTIRWAISIAASIVIILSAGIFAYLGNNGNKNKTLADTYSDPKEAYFETQKTLLLVSEKLNKGIQQMEKVNNIINKDVKL